MKQLINILEKKIVSISDQISKLEKDMNGFESLQSKDCVYRKLNERLKGKREAYREVSSIIKNNNY